MIEDCIMRQTGYGYFVNQKGDVFSFKSNRTKKLRTRITPFGYEIVWLSVNGRKMNRFVHRLVAETFCDKPENYKELDVDHIDFDKTNNHFSNLRFLSRKENVVRSYKAGRIDRSGERNGRAKLTFDVVEKARELKNSGLKLSDIARRLNQPYSRIGNIWWQKTWQKSHKTRGIK